MSLGFGIICIAGISLLITYILFGQTIDNSFRGKFFYWLKSTIFFNNIFIYLA